MNEAATIEFIETMAITPNILMALGSRIGEVWGEFADEEVIERVSDVTCTIDDLRDELERYAR